MLLSNPVGYTLHSHRGTGFKVFVASPPKNIHVICTFVKRRSSNWNPCWNLHQQAGRHAGRQPAMWEGSAGGTRRNPEQCPNSPIYISHTLCLVDQKQKSVRAASSQRNILSTATFRVQIVLTCAKMACLKTVLYLGVCLSAWIISTAGKTMPWIDR